jgi:lipopolysaccharide/colanic/teichoic acid biosynthesis glycosyltransferase
MTPSKRLFDLVLAAFLLVPLTPMMVIVALIIWATDGRPIFYRSERMRDPASGFHLIKFRTMTVASNDTGVTGRDKADRITPLGSFLRRYRLDELPQLFNILSGDMSFVGPRPPLREYVERFPGIYGKVLQSRPGVTGLASLKYRRHEERLLANCTSPEATDSVYSRRCIPSKARLDLIYQKNRSICLDVQVMISTSLDVFRRQ